MSIKKRCCSAMLAATMLSGIVTQASAVGTEVLFQNNISDGTDPIISEVVIPAQITLQMDKTGAVSVKEKDLKLSNTSQTSKATVKKISVVGKQGFSIADYSSDLESKPEGTKEVALQFNGDGTTSSGDVVLTSNWEIEPSNDKALTINAKMPKQPADFEVSGGIATINWEIDTEETGINPDQSTIDDNWTKDKVLKTSVTPVIFTYDSTNPSTTLQSVESSNPDIVSITDAGAGASFGNEQTANYNVQALAVGRSTITATLSTGESTQFDVEVYELDIPGSSGDGTTGEIEVPEVPGKGDGDTIETGDVTIDIPITTPDGEDTITVTPEIPEDTVLGEGENTIEVDVEVDGVTIHITIVINIASSNPSNGLTQSVADAQAMGFTFSSYEDGLQIDSFENKQFKSEVNVPEQIGDFKVRSIGANVFENQSNLKKITLPDTVTNIGDYAFKGCSGLTEMTIPKSVTAIGKEIISGAGVSGATLTVNCNIPNGTYQVERFTGSRFSNIVIGNSATSIGSYAFYKCAGLTSITIPTSVTSIDSYAFRNCTGLTSITIPTSVTSIGNGTFAYCAGLTSITIPTSVTSIDSYAFYYCTKLQSVNIENGVASIGDEAFYNCTGLTSITIPTSVTSIGEDAFRYCTGLTSITIPTSVTSIGAGAFAYCAGLTSINIENGVTSIGEDAFRYCTGLTSITIPTSVTSIGAGAFAYCAGLTSITIPTSVTSIDSYAFRNCTGLTSITIPTSVTSIGAGAFEDCTGLTSITIPTSVTSIGAKAFDNCTKLQSVNIPDSVTSIRTDAFKNVPHIYYNGTASGAPWGASAIN